MASLGTQAAPARSHDNPWDILCHQHRVIEQSLRLLADEDVDPEQARSILDRLRTEFLLHAQAEERVLYARFVELAELGAVIHAAHREHEVLSRALDALRDDDDLERWRRGVRALELAVCEHFDAEEERLYPRLRGQLDVHEARHMALVLHQLFAPAP